MKRILLVCAAVMALLTHAHAFNFGGIIKDMKDSAITVKNSAKDSVETIKDDTILQRDEQEAEENELLKEEVRFKKEKKAFEDKLEKLAKEKENLSKILRTQKEQNSQMYDELKKTKSEKSTLEHYVELLGVISGLLFILLVLLWSSSRKKEETS